MKNSVRLWISPLLFTLVALPLLALAAEKEFRVSSDRLEAMPANTPQAVLITKLKHLAVSDYLKGLLGSKFVQFESTVTPEFAERFVLEYRANRVGAATELVGNLDATALRQWVQLNEAKVGSGWKPAVLFSSSLPGFSFGPRESGKRLRESAIGQAILGAVSPALQRYNVRFLIPNDLGTSLTSPARGEDQMRSLRSAVATGGLNGAVWAHLSPCPGCGTKLDIYVYDLARPRLIWGRSDEMKLEARDFANGERVKKIVRETLKELPGDFEELLSSGLMTSHPLRLVVEDINHYRLLKSLIKALGQLDYAAQSQFKRSSARTAEFEIMTTLSTEEFRKRLQDENFRDFKLTIRSADSESLTARLTKI